MTDGVKGSLCYVTLVFVGSRRLTQAFVTNNNGHGQVAVSLLIVTSQKNVDSRPAELSFSSGRCTNWEFGCQGLTAREHCVLKSKAIPELVSKFTM
jgi:hypothetical protein